MAGKQKRINPLGWSDDEKRVLCKVYPGGDRKGIEKALWQVRAFWRRKRLRWDAIRKEAQRLGLRMREASK
jgi:hypothetical protein